MIKKTVIRLGEKVDIDSGWHDIATGILIK